MPIIRKEFSRQLKNAAQECLFHSEVQLAVHLEALEQPLQVLEDSVVLVVALAASAALHLQRRQGLVDLERQQMLLPRLHLELLHLLHQHLVHHHHLPLRLEVSVHLPLAVLGPPTPQLNQPPHLGDSEVQLRQPAQQVVLVGLGHQQPPQNLPALVDSVVQPVALLLRRPLVVLVHQLQQVLPQHPDSVDLGQLHPVVLLLVVSEHLQLVQVRSVALEPLPRPQQRRLRLVGSELLPAHLPLHLEASVPPLPLRRRHWVDLEGRVHSGPPWEVLSVVGSVAPPMLPQLYQYQCQKPCVSSQ